MPAVDRPHRTADLVRTLLGPEPVPLTALSAIGLTRGQVRAALRAGTLVAVRRGVVRAPLQGALEALDHDGPQGWSAPDARPEIVRQARAALLVLGRGSVVSHETAAVLHGLPTYRRPSGRVQVTAPRHGRVVAGTHRRLGTVDERDRVEKDGLPCTSAARTALDLARRRPLHEALVPLDAALAMVGPHELRAAMARLDWIYDLPALSQALSAADPRAESPLESISRGRMIGSGIPAPELQQWIEGDDGTAYRVDFLWPARKVVGEADGLAKYATVEDVRAEKRREDALRRSGFTIVRWTYAEITRSPDAVLARLRHALA